jgi:hypothetical protein
MRYSVAHTVCRCRNAAELERRAEATGRKLSELRDHAVAGSPAEVVDRLGQFGEIGADGAYVQILDLHDLDHVELIATEVLPQLAWAGPGRERRTGPVNRLVTGGLRAAEMSAKVNRWLPCPLRSRPGGWSAWRSRAPSRSP